MQEKYKVFEEKEGRDFIADYLANKTETVDGGCIYQKGFYSEEGVPFVDFNGHRMWLTKAVAIATGNAVGESQTVCTSCGETSCINPEHIIVRDKKNAKSKKDNDAVDPDFDGDVYAAIQKSEELREAVANRAAELCEEITDSDCMIINNSHLKYFSYMGKNLGIRNAVYAAANPNSARPEKIMTTCGTAYCTNPNHLTSVGAVKQHELIPASIDMKGTSNPYRRLNESKVAKNAAKDFIRNNSDVTEVGCWNFLAKTNKKNNYVDFGGVSLSVQKLSYAAFRGGVSAKDSTSMACNNPNCVNPDHIKLKKNNNQYGKFIAMQIAMARRAG